MNFVLWSTLQVTASGVTLPGSGIYCRKEDVLAVQGEQGRFEGPADMHCSQQGPLQNQMSILILGVAAASVPSTVMSNTKGDKGASCT